MPGSPKPSPQPTWTSAADADLRNPALSGDDRITAWNMTRDPRISAVRDEDIPPWPATEPTWTFAKHIQRHLEVTISRNLAQGLHHASNDGNEVTDPGGLVHVLNLTALFRAARNSNDNDALMEVFFAFVAKVDFRRPDSPNGELARLLEQDPGVIVEFVNDCAVAAPRHPTWAMPLQDWDELERSGHVKADQPATWQCAVGVGSSLRRTGRNAYESVLLLFRYALRPGVKIFRPTQLEAGDYPYHYPSPAEHPRDNGGLVMPLFVEQPEGLVREFVHETVMWEPGQLWRHGISTPLPWPVDRETIAPIRRRHWELVKVTYPSWRDGFYEPEG